MLKIKGTQTIHKIDRWLLNHVFNRKRIFTIQLSMCVDEFGNTFGKNGTYFFIQALNKGEDFNSISNFLIKTYNKSRIMSFNQEVDYDIGSNEGNQYFCPWEKNRIRPLSKFINSHKIGPTDNKSLPIIVKRLLVVLDIIKNKRKPSWRLFDGYPRVIKILNKDQKELYLVRDGVHRLSVYSYLGFESIKVISEFDHWKPSKFLLWAYRILKKQDYLYQHHSRIINELEANDWPHVQSGLVPQRIALKFFHNRFSNAFKRTLEKIKK